MAPYTRELTQTGFISHEQRRQGFDLNQGMHQTGGTWTVKLFEIKSPRTSQRVSPTSGDEQTASEYKAQQKKKKKEEEWKKHCIDNSSQELKH